MATFLFHSLLILIIEFCAVIISIDAKSEENYASPREHGNSIHKFNHPGVLVSIGQLRYAKQQLHLGNEPWKSAFAAMANNSLAAMDYQPNPRAVVECGANSLPNNGCTDERNDALAAYTQALLWFFTDDEQHAEKAIQIMDAWSAQLQAHNNSNALLQAAWSGASFSRAAELIAHTYVNRIDCPKNSSQEGETWPDQPRFKRMLKSAFVSILRNGIGCKNGNWELIITDALIGMAVYLEDDATFQQAIHIWRNRLPAYIYLSEDGQLPRAPVCSPDDPRNCPLKDRGVCPLQINATESSRKAELLKYWQNQAIFVDGIAQETCRDFGHMAWGIHAASHVAETAWHQGIDLYTEATQRLVLGANFHALFQIGQSPVPSWLCNGTLKLGLGPVFEVLYNHYTNRRGLSSMPSVDTYLRGQRPMWANYFFGWETLTHANNPH